MGCPVRRSSKPFAITHWISAFGNLSLNAFRKGRLWTTSPRELGFTTRIL